MRAQIITPGRLAGRRSLRRVAAAFVALVALLAALAGPASAAPPTDDGPTAAALGAAWLAVEVDGGLPLVNFGSPDWGATLDAGVAFAGSGVGSSQVAAIWTALVENRETVVAPFGSDSPGRLAKLVLFARALGKDPRAVGDAPGADLVTRLDATRQVDGSDAGLFGTDDATYDGAFRQGIAIVALQAAGATVDPAASAWLEAQQCADGSWMPYRSDLSVPCAFDAGRFVGPDSNSVAAALAGLLATSPDSPAVEPALTWLDARQNADGGWGFFPDDGSDPNSTAIVMQALIPGGMLDDARFADRGGTPLAALLAFQLGCDAPAEDRGAFTYPFSNDAPSLLATTQALPAAAGAPLDHVAGELATAVTPLDCEPPGTVAPTTTPPTAAPSETVAPSGTAEPTGPAVPTGPADPNGIAATTPLDPVAAGVLDTAASSPTASASSGAAASALALTGAPTLWLLVLGAAMLTAGVTLVARARRNASAA